MPTEREQPEFQKISCKIPWTLWRQGKIRAMDENVDFQDLVVKALESYLRAAAKQGKEGR